MNIEVLKPSNNELQKYIECFYVLTHKKEEGKTTYFTFPSVYSVIAVASNIEVTRTKDFIKINQSLEQNFISELDVKYTNPLLIQYEGDVKEITTYFKPLGLNAFLNKSLNCYCSNEESNFFPFSNYISIMESILKINSSIKIKEKLEEYWISKLKTNVNFKSEKAIKSIINNPDIPISLIAKSNNTSHKTLISHFYKNVCKTPTQFRKIIRFREALQNKKDNSLTQLSYLSNYFDQAHMVKDFKKLTGYNPKDFFKNLSSIDDKVNWIFTER